MEGFLEKYLLQQGERNNKLNIIYATNEKKKDRYRITHGHHQ